MVERATPWPVIKASKREEAIARDIEASGPEMSDDHRIDASALV